MVSREQPGGLKLTGNLRLDFRRLPDPVFDPPRAHFPEQRLVIESTETSEMKIPVTWSERRQREEIAWELACVAWRFWLGALSNKGGRGQRNREEIGAGAT